MHWKSWRMAGAPCALSFITLLLSGLIAAAQTPTPANAQQTPANAQQTPASAQQTPANAPPAFSCDQNATRPRAGGASVAQTAGESLQHKNWQPIGGLIEFTINSFTAIDADAAVTTCFRWKVESGTPHHLSSSDRSASISRMAERPSRSRSSSPIRLQPETQPTRSGTPRSSVRYGSSRSSRSASLH